MKNLYVACTAMGKRLVIAKVGKRDDLCLDQKECEGEIMRALVDKFLDGTTEARHVFRLNGRGYTLTLSAEPPLCEDEGCPQHGTDHVCVISNTN